MTAVETHIYYFAFISIVFSTIITIIAKDKKTMRFVKKLTSNCFFFAYQSLSQSNSSNVIMQIGRTVMIFGARTALGSGANRRHAASGGHQRLEIKTFAIQTGATRRIANPMTSMRKSKVCIDHLTRVCVV
jgi:hypothetical protein